ncbi:hypothetical protein GCM10010388_69050 [Streptomyces mauvecolor]
MLARSRLAVRIANRRVGNWALENAPWPSAEAGRYVIGKPAEWGYALNADQRADMAAVTVVRPGPPC